MAALAVEDGKHANGVANGLGHSNGTENHLNANASGTKLANGVNHASGINHTDIVQKSLDNTQKQWLIANLPIIAQPAIDIRNRNDLLGLFFDFKGDKCYLNIVYEGEASYNRQNPESINHFGTFLYRSYNYRLYNRTADIDDFVFHGVDLNPAAKQAWRDISTTDYGGDQTWAEGDKANFLRFYSVVHHYSQTIPFDQWERSGSRPIVYLNTSNHMHCTRDLNPELVKKKHTHYPVWHGTREHAEHYCKNHVGVKVNLYTIPRLMAWPLRYLQQKKRSRTKNTSLQLVPVEIFAEDMA